MLKPIIAVAICVLALMLLLKDGHLMRTAGLTGYCKVVQTFPDSSELTACRAGRLEGAPDLSHRGCKSVQARPAIEYWRCPAGFDISDVGR